MAMAQPTDAPEEERKFYNALFVEQAFSKAFKWRREKLRNGEVHHRRSRLVLASAMELRLDPLVLEVLPTLQAHGRFSLNNTVPDEVVCGISLTT